VRGIPAHRAASLVAADVPVELRGAATRFVSRGGDKLDGALGRLRVPVAGRRWLDAGASTGGFSDRLLQGGAAAVAAVDVGYGQLDWKLRNDPRVTVLERTHICKLTSAELPWRPSGVVADLSFISLRLVVGTLAALAEPDADFLLLVKPQFEVGRDALPKGAVVRDPEAWQSSIVDVVAGARRHGLGLVAAVAAHPPGPAGNREFFVHLRRGATGDVGIVRAAVAEAAP
jgi:23S rRNA (cytidine1920-2'-O)/16S rRNA (cytidine1409-2'-O)-methyltransferase